MIGHYQCYGEVWVKFCHKPILQKLFFTYQLVRLLLLSNFKIRLFNLQIEKIYEVRFV